MNKPQVGQPPSLLVWATTASVLSGELFIWPLHLVMVAGQNSDLVLIWVVLWMIAVTELSPHPDSLDGTWLTVHAWLQGIACLGLIAMDGIMLVELAGMLQTFYYFNTPRWALILPIVLVVIWGARGVGVTIWRTIFLWIPVLLSTSFLILTISLTNVRFGRVLLPNQVIVLSNQLQGIFIVAYLGLPLGVTIRALHPLLAKPANRVHKLWAAFAPWMVLAALYVVTMGTIGDQALTRLSWPVVFTLDHVTLDSSFFLSRIGLLVVFGWTVGVALGIMIHLRFLLMLANSKVPRISRYLTYCTGLWWTIESFALKSPNSAASLLIHTFDPMSALYLLAEMGFILAWRGFRRHGKNAPT